MLWVDMLWVDGSGVRIVYRERWLGGEQDRRGERLAREGEMAVAFASHAGPTDGGFDATAGHSPVWGPDGARLARANAEPGGFARATLQRPR